MRINKPNNTCLNYLFAAVQTNPRSASFVDVPMDFVLSAPPEGKSLGGRILAQYIYRSIQLLGITDNQVKKFDADHDNYLTQSEFVELTKDLLGRLGKKKQPFLQQEAHLRRLLHESIDAKEMEDLRLQIQYVNDSIRERDLLEGTLYNLVRQLDRKK